MNWTVVAPATLGWRKFNEPLVGRENSTRAAAGQAGGGVGAVTGGGGGGGVAQIVGGGDGYVGNARFVCVAGAVVVKIAEDSAADGPGKRGGGNWWGWSGADQNSQNDGQQGQQLNGMT